MTVGAFTTQYTFINMSRPWTLQIISHYQTITGHNGHSMLNMLLDKREYIFDKQLTAQ